MGRSPLILVAVGCGYGGSMLVLHHDFTSLRSAVAVHRCQRLVDGGTTIEFRGIDVVGIEATLPTTLEQQADFRAAVDDARALGLEARAPRVRPPTVRAHLVTELAHARGLAATWRHVVHVAYFVDGVDIGDSEVLAELATSIGVERDAVVQGLGDRGRIVELRRRMAMERQRGIGGVPVLEFDGTMISADLTDERLAELASLSSSPRH